MSEQFTPSWRTVELRQIASFVSGGTPSRKEEKYFTGTIPWLTGYDLPEDKIVDIFQGREQITEDAILGSATSPVEAGTVLLTTRVTVGKVAIARTKLCFSQDVTGIIIENTDVLLPEFLAHYLLATRELLLRRNRGSTIQGVIRRDVERLQIPIPPLSEQQQIIKILKQAEEVRQIRQQADGRIQNLQTSLFYEMFGDPVSNTKNWKSSRLDKVGVLDRGRSRHRPRDAQYLYGGPYPFIQTGDIANSNGWITEYSQTYSEAGLQQSRLWKKGTLCITIAANIAKTGILCFDACFPDSVVGFTPGDEILVEYVRQWFEIIQEKLDESAPQGAQKNINLRILRNLTIPLPPLDLQEKFSNAIRDLHELNLVSSKSKKLLNEFTASLLGQAFTGNLTTVWRESNLDVLHDESVKRDIVLGARGKEPHVKDFLSGQITRAERERFEQTMREAFLPAMKQLLENITPTIQIQSIMQGALLQMSEMIAPMLPSFKDMVDANMISNINALTEETRIALAASFNPIHEFQQSMIGQINAQQSEIFDLAKTMSRLAAEVVRRPDENHPRYHVLNALSDEQYWVYIGIRQQEGYFTTQSLSADEDFSLETVRRTLPLLETLGLIRQVSVGVPLNNIEVYFIDAYRKPVDKEDIRFNDIETLNKFISDPSKINPTL